MNIPSLSCKVSVHPVRSVRYSSVKCRALSSRVSVTSTPKDLGILAYAYTVTTLCPTVFHTVCWFYTGTVFVLSAHSVHTVVGLVLTNPGLCWCQTRSEEHTSELQSQSNLVCRLLLEKKKKI